MDTQKHWPAARLNADEEDKAAYVHEMEDAFFFYEDTKALADRSIAALFEHQRTHGKKRKAPAPAPAPAAAQHDLACGDHITMDGSAGVVVAVPINKSGKWLVRLDGEDTDRSAYLHKSPKFTKLARTSQFAAPATAPASAPAPAPGPRRYRTKWQRLHGAPAAPTPQAASRFGRMRNQQDYANIRR